MTRIRLLAVVVGCVLVGPPGNALAGDTKAETASAEVKWARGVIEDMFASAFLRETRQVEALASPRLLSAFWSESQRTWFGNWLVKGLSEGGFHSVVWTGWKVSRDKNEIRFTGILRGERTRESGTRMEPKLEDYKVEASCIVRVGRVKGTKKWRVDYVYFKDREQAAGGGDEKAR